MSIENIFQNCSNFRTDRVGAFIDPDEAKRRFIDRLDKENTLHGFLVSLDVLKDFIVAIDKYNIDARVANKDEITSIRIWKGAYKKTPECKAENGTIFEDIEHFFEDLMMMPVFSNGNDAYGNDDFISKDFEIPNSTTSDKPKLILASMRPCPEWCNTKGRKDFLNEPYFHRKPDTNGYQRASGGSIVTVDPYLGVCKER